MKKKTDETKYFQPGCTEACLGQACVDFPIEDLIK